MDLTPATLWWILAGALVAIELLTGTFYLLMLAFGAAAGAMAAHAGLTTAGQILVAAVLGGGATAAWHLRRARHPRSAPAERNPDVNPDIGQTVQVDAWNADGTARVSYRGALWSVRFAGDGAPASGVHQIVAVHGTRLDLVPVAR